MFVKLIVLVALFQSVAHANYCNYNGCSGVPMGCCGDSDLLYCNGNSDQCGDCSGEWCSGSFSYCTWSTCDGVIRSTEWCNAAASNCEGACGGMWCTNGGSEGTGPTAGGPTPAPLPVPTTPAPVNPSSGSATTTRYWDCSGGACGCAYLPFGQGTDWAPSHCYSNAMFAAPTGNEHGATFYGTAAVSQILFGYNTQWLGPGCGTCYKLTGTSNIAGTPTTTTTIVLKAANLCPPENPACSGNKVHFDIAVPGFDVTQYSFAHVCPSRESAEDAGFSACEFWMSNGDPTQNCDCSAFNSPVLEAGCNNFLSLNWNNPSVQYESVECPFELERLNCWEENGNQYPFGVPEFCESNVDDSPTDPPVTTPTDVPVPPPTVAPVPPPTAAPVNPPTVAPVPPPTAAPVSPPTVAPVPPPTAAPVPPPTVAPVPPPTAAPVNPPTVAPVPPPTAAPVNPPTVAPVPPPTTPPVNPPTVAPVPPPTAAPVPPPTQAPVPPPTQAPVPPPTQAPVPPPTQAPVPAPTNAPGGGDGSFCCSNNYKDCDVSGWCAENQSRCEGNCNGSWIKVGHCPANGIPLYGECTNNVDGCCIPAICQGNQSYRQCL